MKFTPLLLLVAAPLWSQTVIRVGPASVSLGGAAASVTAPLLDASGAPALSAPVSLTAPGALLSAPVPAISAVSAVAVVAAPGQAPVAALASPAFSAAATPLPPDGDPAAAKDAQDRLYEGSSPSAADRDTGYVVEFSQPGKIGELLRRVWPAHTFFRVKQTKTAINDFLPAKLKAFPQKKPSMLTRIKRSVLFSPPVVALIRSQLAQGWKAFEGGTDREIFEKLPTHADETPGKYNIVIEGGVMTVARLVNGAKVPDWLLSKHVLMSGYSKDVRFAGEMWKASDGKIHLSNNSGTYRPSAAQLEQAVAYLSAVFPGVEFVGDFAELAPAPPAPAPKPSLLARVKTLYTGGSDTFKKEVRRKLIHQKNWLYLGLFLWLGHWPTVYVFASMTAVFGVIGVLRLKWKPLRDWAQKHVSVLRAKEAKHLTGTFYGALGVTVAAALFGWSTPLVAAGLLAYTVGDAVSPLVGLRFGWKPFTVAGTKRSVDGALASFTLVLLMNLLLGFSPLVALAGALAFSAVDVYPVKPDDNFWIPIAVPAALFLAGLI
ncbi:MAG: hypothetical protein HY923_09505 [Elusimicrobia bacterium]|nr:hypothetical protein [Elusimicrobiota bacterium]